MKLRTITLSFEVTSQFYSLIMYILLCQISYIQEEVKRWNGLMTLKTLFNRDLSSKRDKIFLLCVVLIAWRWPYEVEKCYQTKDTTLTPCVAATYLSCYQLSCSQINILVLVLRKMSLPTVRILPFYFFQIHFNITLHLRLSKEMY